jgi:hypothetical protein
MSKFMEVPMADRPDTVVGETTRLTKPRLHSLLMQGWARAIAKHGKGGFADKVEITGPALDKQLTGSTPTFEVIDRALDACPTVLDEYFDAKGLRLVAREAVCDTDDASVHIARLMLWLQEAQHPDSPGGRRIVHTELVGAEVLIRALHGATGNWLAQITNLRAAA